MSPSIVALIPSRAGSKRIPGKNTKDFFGHPLIAYTIHAAKESGIFSEIVVSTDSGETALVGYRYGANRCPRRSEAAATDTAPDIWWVREALPTCKADAFAILRPTSPFRTAEMIQRAWQLFLDAQPCDSLRAVERVRQHPYKMWRVDGKRMSPLCYGYHEYQDPFALVDWHSCPTQTLDEIYVQNASLEIAWTRTVTDCHSIAGTRIVPFVTEGYESLDINSPDDWTWATSLVNRGLVALPALAPQTATAPQK